MTKGEKFLLAVLGWMIIGIVFLTIHYLEFWHQQASALVYGQ